MPSLKHVDVFSCKMSVLANPVRLLGKHATFHKSWLLLQHVHSSDKDHFPAPEVIAGPVDGFDI